MFVACSTLCFSSRPLADAMRHMVELEFNKVDLAIHENGPQLKPSQVASDPEAVLAQLREGPSLGIASLDVRFGDFDAETRARHYAAMCRFAKSLMVAVITIPASPLGTPVAYEIARLRTMAELATSEGLVLTVLTESDTLTSDPKTVLQLCEAVPGLGVTLDPSHYINGPLQSDAFDEIYPFVQSVHFRDTGKKPGEFQVRVGQGEVEYGKVVAQLERFRYERGLVVAIHDRPDNAFDIELEVRKLKLLLESLI